MLPDYTARDLRHADVENDIARQLRAMPEAEAFGEVRQLVRLDAAVGLRLARRVLRRSENFRSLLREGLEASSGRALLEHFKSAAGTIGFDRTFDLVRDRLGVPPEAGAVDRYLPWLLMAAPDDAARSRVNAVAEEFAAAARTERREWIRRWRAWQGLDGPAEGGDRTT